MLASGPIGDRPLLDPQWSMARWEKRTFPKVALRPFAGVGRYCSDDCFRR